MRAAHRRTNVEGVRLHYRVAGRGNRGVPVVCLPAPGQSSGSLKALLAEVGRNRLAFALDLPGHGRSGNPPSGRRDPAWWLLAWLSRLGFERCHLVVTGGALGVATDAVHRSRRTISSVTLLAPPSLDPRSAGQRLEGALASSWRAAREPGTVTNVGARLRSQTAAAFREAMYPRDVAAEVSSLALPLLVVRGEHDRHVTRDEASRLARRGHATFIDLPGAPRAAWTTNAAAIAETLERWWSSLDEGGPEVSGLSVPRSGAEGGRR